MRDVLQLHAQGLGDQGFQGGREQWRRCGCIRWIESGIKGQLEFRESNHDKRSVAIGQGLVDERDYQPIMNA
jgi:hypothetical protein